LLTGKHAGMGAMFFMSFHEFLECFKFHKRHIPRPNKDVPLGIFQNGLHHHNGMPGSFLFFLKYRHSVIIF